MVALVRVHGLSCSKASASYSARCRVISAADFTDQVKRGAVNASALWVKPGLFSPCQHEHEGAFSKTEWNGGFGFQTKVKDHCLNQRR